MYVVLQLSNLRIFTGYLFKKSELIFHISRWIMCLMEIRLSQVSEIGYNFFIQKLTCN